MKFMKNLLLAALPALASPAFAETVGNDGYARDASTAVVKNPFGLCWRRGQGGEAKAIADCDPDYVPKAAPRVEAPARPVAPAVEPRIVEAPRPAPVPVAAAPIAEPAPPIRAKLQSITLGADASFATGKPDPKADAQTNTDHS